MTTELSTLIGNFRREVGGPDIASVADDLITQHLSDGFYDSQLDGLLQSYALTTQFVTSPYTATTVTNDLSGEQQQLIVFYAGCRYIRNEIRNTDTQFRAHTGPAEFEVHKSATALVDLLKSMESRKALLRFRLGAAGLPGATDSFIHDAYSDSSDYYNDYPELYPSA